MARTGHTSTKGVRSYKRIGEQLLEETSDILNRKKCKPDKEVVPLPSVAPAFVPTPSVPPASVPTPVPPASVPPPSTAVSVPQLGLFNISSSTITFNVMPNN